MTRILSTLATLALVACAVIGGVDAAPSAFRPAHAPRSAHADVESLSKLIPSGSKRSPMPHDMFAPNGGAPWQGGDIFAEARAEHGKKRSKASAGPRQARPIPTEAALDGPIADTQYGPVQGYNTDGVNIWRGVPYAAPPVGNYRWREPQDAQPWNSTLQTYAQANICPQIHIFDWLYLGNEDCLYADVYSPVGASKNNPLPVFVWIYGGAYVIGDGWEFGLYDGTAIAATRNHIVVTFNYRLGPLGFMANDAIRADNPAGYAGNWALLDQVKALQWVHDNIASFGGDPSRVTIGGESAGAFSVCWHLVSPLSAGLFHAAILESGTCNDANFFVEYDLQRNWTNTYTQMVGCNPDLPDALSCLRNLPTGAIMGNILGSPLKSVHENVQSMRESHALAASVGDWGFKPKLFPLMSWGCTIDGVALLDMPLSTIWSGDYNKVNVIMGTNNDEGTMFVPMMPLIIPGVHFPTQAGDLAIAMNYVFSNNATITAGIEAQYPLSSYASPEDAFNAILRDYMFVCSSRRALKAMVAQNASTYLYHFHYLGDWIEDPLLGDYHSSELEFVWDNQWPPIIHAFSQKDQTMANTMDTYWSNMVWYLNPNGNGSAASLQGEEAWPVFEPVELLDMVLAVPTQVERDYFEQTCNFWDQYEQGSIPSNPAPKAAIKKDAPPSRLAPVAQPKVALE